MLDFFYETLRPVNLPFTALMAAVTFYWLLVMLGALDFDSEPSLDLHSHDVDIDGAAGAHDLDHAGAGGHDIGAIDEHKPVVGRTCTILTSEVTDKFGQAQIDTDGAPLVINVRTYGDVAFNKGESALIIKEDKENNLFTVAKLTSTTPQQETTLC